MKKGQRHSPETRARISASLKSPETRAKLIAAKNGRTLGPQHRASISAALNRPEVRAKLSAAKKGRTHSPETRVAHDNWCGVFRGEVCNCNPEVTLLEVHDPARN
jgi:hypothetical protein